MTSSSSSARCWAQHTARRAVLLLLWTLALYGPLLPLASAAIPFQQHPVDWTLVPAKPEAAADLSTSCICALLNGTCTPGCCCDSACTADLVQSFKAKGQCLPEGTPPQQLPYCVPAEPFAKVNLPAGDYYRLQQRAADSDFISQVLCVTADHNPSLGKSYPDPPAGDVSSNAQEAACPAAPTPPVAGGPGNGYAYGQALAVVGAVAPAIAGLRVWGTFVLPAGVLSAECLDVQQVGYMARVPSSLRVPASTCQRTFSTAAALTAMCNDATSPLSPTYWAGLAFPAKPAATTTTPVSLKSLANHQLDTGVWTQLDPVADLKDPVAAVGPPVMCSGVVVEAHFLMRSSTDPDTGALMVSAMQLSLVIADVAMPAAGPLVLDTAFSVQWANATVPDAALQPLSGAPGYLPGFPLLAGLQSSDPAPTDPSVTRKAVSRLSGGLQLPGPGPAGRCSPSPVYAPTIGWGYNLSSSCTIGLTLAQLRTLCQANDPPKTLTDIMGAEWLTSLTTEQVLLGIWGNSDPNNIKHWLPLVTTEWPPTTDLQWDEPTSTCSNVPKGLQVRLLTGVAYSESNLQSKLLYASACFTHGSWTFDRLNGPTLQLFELNFQVSFVPKAGQQPTTSLKPTPPLIAPLPPDLFYPFLTSAAGVPVRAGGMRAQQWLVMGVLVWIAHVAAAWL